MGRDRLTTFAWASQLRDKLSGENTWLSRRAVTDLGSLVPETQTLTATGTYTPTNGVVALNHASVIIAATAAASWDPEIGDTLTIVDTSATGTAAHTFTLPAGHTLYDASSNNRMTLNALYESITIRFIGSGKWIVVVNIGSVALSAV